jgi:hypothetical protein
MPDATTSQSLAENTLYPRRYNPDEPEGRSCLTPMLYQQVHALFCQWVKLHCHRRDFICALDHETSLLLFGYLMAEQPGIPLNEVPPIQSISLSPAHYPSEEECQGPRHRFYNNDDSLNSKANSSFMSPGLAALFMAWVADGWVARDFCHAIRDVALAIVYHFDVTMSMGGLGGCKTEETFLNTPYSR